MPESHGQKCEQQCGQVNLLAGGCPRCSRRTSVIHSELGTEPSPATINSGWRLTADNLELLDREPIPEAADPMGDGCGCIPESVLQRLPNRPWWSP